MAGATAASILRQRRELMSTESTAGIVTTATRTECTVPLAWTPHLEGPRAQQVGSTQRSGVVT